jgi:hypothetical protein
MLLLGARMIPNDDPDAKLPATHFCASHIQSEQVAV